MKANAPEKIWINSPQDLPCGFVDKSSVEYIRTDAFIEKAIKWIEKNFNMPDDFKEHFKKAMML